MQPDPAIGAFLKCPSCKGAFEVNGSLFTCANCGHPYGIDDGICLLTENSTAFGELSSAEMREFVRAAEKSGWESALDAVVKPKDPAVVDRIVDPRRTRFLDLLDGSKSGLAIDIGCGFGGVALQLSRHFDNVIALDSGLERLQVLNVIRKQRQVTNITTIHYDNVRALPLASNCADLITLVGVFEYLPAAYVDRQVPQVQQDVLQEIRRILKPGGKLYLATKNRFGLPYWKGARDHNGLRFGPILPRGMANWLTQHLAGKPYRIIVDSFSDYLSMLKAAGFGDTRFFWPIPGYQFPDRFIALNPRDDSRPAHQVARAELSWKFRAAAILQRFNLLKHLATNFSIVAQKDG